MVDHVMCSMSARSWLLYYSCTLKMVRRWCLWLCTLIVAHLLIPQGSRRGHVMDIPEMKQSELTGNREMKQMVKHSKPKNETRNGQPLTHGFGGESPCVKSARTLLDRKKNKKPWEREKERVEISSYNSHRDGWEASQRDTWYKARCAPYSEQISLIT